MINRRFALKGGALASLAGLATLHPLHARATTLLGNLLTNLTQLVQTAVQQAVYTLPTDNGTTVSVTTSTTRLDGRVHPKFVNALPDPYRPLNCFLPTDLLGTSYVLRLREFNTRIGLVNPAG